MRRTFTLYLLTVIAILGLQAQTQQGYIRTIGRPDKKGEPLANVSIRLKGEHNAVLSSNDGKFALVMHGKKNGDSYSLQQVRKKGYLLNDAGVIGRSFAFSDRIPHTILMVSATQLQKDKQRIENNAYRVAEKNFEEKLTKLEQEVNDSIISAEKYREELLTLQKSFEKYQLLIEGLADHYAHTDYDNLNEREREINLCIENGELDRADSLIHTLFNPLEVLKRNKEAMLHIEQQISQANAIIANADIEMAKVIKQQNKEAEYLYHLYTIALARFDNKNAEYYIETRAELDTANAGWQFDAAYYAHKQNRHKTAELYYTRALASSKELARKDPQAHEPEVASILNNLASLYIDIQRHTDSENTYKETLEIYRRLAKENPEVYEPDLSLIQNNLALLYINTRRYNEAETLCSEALQTRKRLAAEEPLIYEPYLATTLNNLALLYSNTERYIESEQTYMNALEIYCRLAEGNPVTYEPYIATTLNSLAILYYNTQQYEKSEQMCKETQDIRNKFNNNAHTYDPNVATTLNNLGTFYYNTRRYEESEAMYKEAQEIYKHLAQENPQAYEPYVAMTLNNLASIYSDTKRYEEGEKTYKVVLEMRRRFAQEDPHVYEPDVARTLNNLALLYSDMKRYEESIEMYKEALAIRRGLAQENPQAYSMSVAMTLNNLASLYYNTKQIPESEPLYREAVGIYRELAKTTPQQHKPYLAQTLNNLASLYQSTKRASEAEELYKEAIETYRSLATDNPQTYEPDVARALNNLASLYSDTKRYKEGEALYNEALAIRRKLAEKSPEYFEQAVALTQYNLGMLYLRDKQYTKGLVSFEEALSIYRRLAIEEPMMQLHYTNSLKWVVQLYKNTKEKHKSYDVYEEYMPIIKSNYEKRPDIYRTEYLKALAYQASQCLEMDKYTKAEEYTREELNINPISMQAYRNLAILLVLQERYAEAEEIYFKYKPKLKDEFNADLKLYKKAKKITKKHKAGLRRINLILYDR